MMGCSVSKNDRNEALHLCKERVQYIKQAIDSRYALSAAHLSYIQSLHNVGTKLMQLAEYETLIESSLSTSKPEKSPSHSSYASPSPTQIAEPVGSPSLSGSPFSPQLSNMSYMRTTASSSLKVMVDQSSYHYIEEESLTSPLPPPPPPPEIGLSWDFFDPTDAIDNAGFPNGEGDRSQNFSRVVGLKEEVVVPLIEGEVMPSQTSEELAWVKVNSPGNAGSEKMMCHPHSINTTSLERSADLRQKQVFEGRWLNSESSSVNGSVESLARMASSELSRSKIEKAELEKEQCRREDSSEFITRRAKDFLSSLKDIEHRFTRAAESGHEVSRMLETNKIRVSVLSETIGKSSDSMFLSAFHLVCCMAENAQEPDMAHHVTKVITWNRSVSSLSSSSRNPLTEASKEGAGESGSGFIEDFCMISGSHSSTLDRLYAWERKLYDEVKASEYIMKAYDQKCTQLRHQFARDLNAQVIDKTRAIVKDLHSQVRVAIQAVDSISRRIERLRDEELQPQLVELIQGLSRMWKAMLESHHAQYITISVAYQAKISTAAPQSESYKQAITNLQNEIDCFGSSFASWVNAQKSYVSALDAWLQKCILPSQERSWGRKVPFSPRRAIAPPIFVLSRDWLAGINSLPSEDVSDSIKGMVSGLHDLFEQQQREEKQAEGRGDKELEHKGSSNLSSLQASLISVFFDRLAKFSENSAKVYEDVRQGSDTARNAYINGRLR